MRVFLHTGFIKTGSSAIQVAMAALRDQLAANGVLYPKGFEGTGNDAERGRISSGNAMALAPLLNGGKSPRPFNKADILAWLRRSIAEADGRDLLFSSEMMRLVQPEAVAELCKFFTEQGCTPVVIMYVRHMLDQALATYMQVLKMGTVTADPEDINANRTAFLNQYVCSYHRELEPFARVLPPEQIIVRLYDKERENLVRGFLGLLSEHEFKYETPRQVVNRSPTEAEQVVFATLGRLPNGRVLCRDISNVALNRPTARSSSLVVSQEDFNRFAARHQPIADLINRQYLKGNGELLLKSDKVSIGEVPKVPPGEVYTAFADLISMLANMVRENNRPAQRPPGRLPL
ncbi:MAG: hypothetical protein NT133_24440 [Alphaproteobacteria bacterium]|nr:hypothetical protein [Alphaproteobacteria bacterium]